MSQSASSFSSARFLALRLLPGEDVLPVLRKYVQQHNLQAAFIASCVGSLTDVALRYAGQNYAGEKGVDLLSGQFEVVSLTGTLDAKGEHVHLAVADEKGTLIGGHMMDGCTVRTTLELVIGELEQVTFQREICTLSTYEELVVTDR